MCAIHVQPCETLLVTPAKRTPRTGVCRGPRVAIPYPHSAIGAVYSASWKPIGKEQERGRLALDARRPLGCSHPGALSIL